MCQNQTCLVAVRSRSRTGSALHCNSFLDEVFCLVRGYIDESYEGKRIPEFFTLSCSLADGGDWAFIEAAWRWVLSEKNRELQANGRTSISRYHAADCFNRINEFKGWGREERDRFGVSLLEIFRYFPTSHFSLTISAKDVSEIWPENQDDPLHFAYNVLLRLLMLEIGRHRYDFGAAGNIALIYERCGYGDALLRGFNRMMDDPTFQYKRLYTTLDPMGWENCIPLQPADLVAYEVFRDSKRRAISGQRSKTLTALAEMPNFRLRTKTLPKDALMKLREMHDRNLAKAKQK